MFFEQLLANYFAQLAHVKNLFSFNSGSSGTYFTQTIEDKDLGLDDVTAKAAQEQADRIQAIMDGVVGLETSLERKNRFLNHLLARYAEQFTDYSLFLFETIPEGVEPANKMIQDKQAYLKQYPAVSSARGAAFDYIQPCSRQNVSGLENRIRLKLGLMEDNDEVFYVVEHVLLRPIVKDLDQELPFLMDAHSQDPYSLQLSFIFPRDWTARLPQPDLTGLDDQGKALAKEAYEDKKARLRRFVEQTVREETPAHLTPYVHWLSKNEMDEFKKAYEFWIEKRSLIWST